MGRVRQSGADLQADENHGSITSLGGNPRNGKSSKTIKGEFGIRPLALPRDRDSTLIRA
jgi:hypothetical protein